jgi:ABC-type lipoprotein release transport system permease subunit
VEGVRLVAPVVDGMALAASSGASGVLVRGIRAADLDQLPSVAGNIQEGSLERFDEGQGVVIGRRLANQLSLRLGDSIAILRTIGASRGSIMRVFMMTGAAIGVVGTLVGFTVGLLVCLNVDAIRQFLSWLTSLDMFPSETYFLSRLPADVDIAETVAIMIVALGLSVMATLYPSWRAARLDPVEALR